MHSHAIELESGAAHTYLTLLQANLARMANNSASCKTWCVTVVAAVLAVTIGANRGATAYTALLPLVILCILDAYYLSMERDYRDLYNRFASDLLHGGAHADRLFDMHPGDDETRRLKDTLAALGSVSIWPVYSAMFIATVVVAVTLGH